MKIRVISDLHIDVNHNYPLIFPDNYKDTFTIIAGDVAGEMMDGIDWVKNNCPKGVCIAGNHLVYNNYGKSIQDLKYTLKEEFPKDGTMKFLENDNVQIDDDTIIVGATLYTDFKLNGMGQESGKRSAERGLNDFRWGYYDHDGQLENVHPDDYVDMFNESIKYIEKICDENPNKNIIVVTHHAPSARSISSSYVGSNLNCAYASDLDDFIRSHKNIKCWIHGHVHDYFEYKIGDCQILANPRGYSHYLEDANWSPNVFIDTETWEVSEDKEGWDKWVSEYRTEEEKKRRKDLDNAYEVLIKAMI